MHTASCLLWRACGALARQVIDEVRDSQSRHVLDTLPFGITIRDVDEEAYAAVK